MEPSSSHAVGLTHKLRAERYKRELEVAERKNENLSWTNKDASRKLFEANQRGQQLAITLGFKDIFEAHAVFSHNPGAFNHFRIEQQSLRFQQLERELKEQQKINSGLQKACQEVFDALQRTKEDNEALRVELKQLQDRMSASNYKRNRSSTSSIDLARDRLEPNGLATDDTALRLELNDLRHRYDLLLEAKDKAAAMYKKDYKKWRDYKRQMYEEAMRDKKNEHRSGRSSAKRKRLNRPSRDLGKEDDTKPILDTEVHASHETKPTPRPRSRADKENIMAPTATLQRIHPINTSPVSSVGRVFPSHRLALHQTPPSRVHATNVHPGSVLEQPSEGAFGEQNRHIDSAFPMQAASVSSSKLKRKRSELKVTLAVPSSSETEDESQDPKPLVSFKFPALPGRSKDRPLQPIIPAPSSKTEDESQDPEPINFFKAPALPAQPRDQALSAKQSAAPASLNNEVPTQYSSALPVKSQRTDTRNKEESSTSHCMGRSRKPDLVHNEGGHGPGIDYSEYKGRGRYGQTAQNDGNTTINAQYQIDANQNNGLDFQYDAVVRNRQERKHLNAGDCECCRDYYEAIGPLPPRLQQPLWRSPTSSPVASRTCQRRGAPGVMLPHGSEDVPSVPGSTNRRDSDIAQHKKDISRHRHNWERASTPPGYWNIGFPSTQEASDINEQARELHRQKLVMVEQEANKMDGRYKKR